MEIKLLHLYGDVMNLYGEYANVSLLARYLKDLGYGVSVDTLSLYEEKDITGYDFYYMGAGTEWKMKLMLPELMKYQKTLQKLCAEGKTILFTGNACDLLGKKITAADGSAYDTLDIGDFESMETNRRITGDCLAKMEGGLLVGFINKCSKTVGVKTPFCTLTMGFGNDKDKGAEGFRRNNCIGTHITGPIMVKNPAMLRYITTLILGKTLEDDVIYPYMEKSYETTKTELLKRLEAMK